MQFDPSVVGVALKECWTILVLNNTLTVVSCILVPVARKMGWCFAGLQLWIAVRLISFSFILGK